MDPLSVSASVVGLLAVTVQVSSMLQKLVSKSIHAPQSLSDLKIEVDAVRLALGELQAFVLRKASASPSRAALLLVDHVVKVLSACVLTFSELERIVQAFDSDDRLGLMDRLRWAAKADAIAEILGRVQNHKTSLILMLQILQSQSQLDAEQAVARLTELVETILSSYQVLQQRLLGSESETIDLEAGNRAANTALDAKNDVAVHTHIQGPAILMGFEKELAESWVYRRSWKSSASDNISVSNLDRRTASWSILSGLSLAAVSVVAVLELPIYAGDLSNASKYKFGTTTSIHMNNTQSSGILARVPTIYDFARTGRETSKFESYTPLHIACQEGRVDIARELLKRGADVNARAIHPEAEFDLSDEDSRCLTPLHLALHYKQREIFDLLIQQPDINVVPKSALENSYLRHAAKWNNLEVFSKLLDLGLDPLAKQKDGLTAWHLAANTGELSILEFIYKAVKDRSDFNVDIGTIFGSTALMCASRRGFTPMCEFLINIGSDIEVSNHIGATAVMYAAAANDPKAFELLVFRGAEIHRARENGWTTLHYAAHHGNTRQVQICLERGMDANIRNALGKTPLHLAARCSLNVEISEALLLHGAEPDARDFTGTSVLDYCNKDGSLYALFKPYLTDFEPWTTEMKRARIIATIGKLLSSDNWQHQTSKRLVWLDYADLANLFTKHGELDSEAKICLETQLVRLRNNKCSSYPSMRVKCHYCRISLVLGSWFMSRRHFARFLCSDCYEKRNNSKETRPGSLTPPPYIEFGGEKWRNLPPGKVNQKGQTIDEWREEQRLIYTQE